MEAGETQTDDMVPNFIPVETILKEVDDADSLVLTHDTNLEETSKDDAKHVSLHTESSVLQPNMTESMIVTWSNQGPTCTATSLSGPVPGILHRVLGPGRGPTPGNTAPTEGRTRSDKTNVSPDSHSEAPWALAIAGQEPQSLQQQQSISPQNISEQLHRGLAIQAALGLSFSKLEERTRQKQRLHSRRQDPTYREHERLRQRSMMQMKRRDPSFRELERQKQRSRMQARRQDPIFRQRERERQRQRMKLKRQDPCFRERERERQKSRMQLKRQDPDFKERERARDRSRLCTKQADSTPPTMVILQTNRAFRGRCRSNTINNVFVDAKHDARDRHNRSWPQQHQSPNPVTAHSSSVALVTAAYAFPGHGKAPCVPQDGNVPNGVGPTCNGPLPFPNAFPGPDQRSFVPPATVAGDVPTFPYALSLTQVVNPTGTNSEDRALRPAGNTMLPPGLHGFSSVYAQHVAPAVQGNLVRATGMENTNHQVIKRVGDSMPVNCKNGMVGAVEASRSPECHPCQQRFTCTEYLEAHQQQSRTACKSRKKAESMRSFGCQRCGAQLQTLSGFKYHESTHSEDTSYQCDTCGKAYANRGNYNRHLRHHSSAHKCEACGKIFRMKQHLKEHMKCHGEKNLCCPHCSYRTCYKYALNRHITIRHTDAKCHKCGTCSAQFKTDSDLEQHRQNCGDVKPDTHAPSEAHFDAT